jgi:hypothetical protein
MSEEVTVAEVEEVGLAVEEEAELVVEVLVPARQNRRQTLHQSLQFQGWNHQVAALHQETAENRWAGTGRETGHHQSMRNPNWDPHTLSPETPNRECRNRDTETHLSIQQQEAESGFRVPGRER